MEYLLENSELPINPHPPLIMYVDINSCFATIEQQANPLLANKPVAVAAYISDRGCILAASTEAKELGVKTGMRVMEGKKLCKELIVLEPDPPKYRYVNRKLAEIFRTFTPSVQVKSIDEAVLDLSQSPFIRKMSVRDIGKKIKREIRRQIGERLTVSIGVGTNSFVAKTASGWEKPDGLTVISKDNWRQILAGLELEDLCGIGPANAGRLAGAGVVTPVQFLDSPLLTLRAAFQSVSARYWYMRLRGWEVDKVEHVTRTVGHSHALAQPTADTEKLNQLLYKLVVKMGRRLREKRYQAGGIHVRCLLDDHSFWHRGRKLPRLVTDDLVMYRQASKLLTRRPEGKKVINLSVNCFSLAPQLGNQLSLFSKDDRLNRVTEAMDRVNNRYGTFRVIPARITGMEGTIVDRVAFGKAGIESVS